MESNYATILKGSKKLLCAHGWAGQIQLPYWRRISQSEIRNSAAEKNWNRKARAGKNSFPPTPFLFARPNDWILKLGIRIFVKECSNFVQKTPPTLVKILNHCHEFSFLEDKYLRGGIRRVRTKPELLQVLDDPGCGGAERDARAEARGQRDAGEQESPPFRQRLKNLKLLPWIPKGYAKNPIQKRSR
jgi:hypothetical protein